MTQPVATRSPVSPERTRQQLQELDALLQQMLALPIAHQNEEDGVPNRGFGEKQRPDFMPNPEPRAEDGPEVPGSGFAEMQRADSAPNPESRNLTSPGEGERRVDPLTSVLDEAATKTGQPIFVSLSAAAVKRLTPLTPTPPVAKPSLALPKAPQPLPPQSLPFRSAPATATIPPAIATGKAPSLRLAPISEATQTKAAPSPADSDVPATHEPSPGNTASPRKPEESIAVPKNINPVLGLLPVRDAAAAEMPVPSIPTKPAISPPIVPQAPARETDSDITAFDLAAPDGLDVSVDDGLQHSDAAFDGPLQPSGHALRRRSFSYRVLLGMNQTYDKTVGLLGPLGAKLSAPRGRNLLGLIGILLLAAAGLVWIVEWSGWTWQR